MKKILTVLLAGGLMLSAAACTPRNNIETPDTPPAYADDLPLTVTTPAEETTAVPETAETTTAPPAETTLVFTDEPVIIHATTPPQPEKPQTAPGTEQGVETTPYIPSETALKWKYNCYTDKTAYRYDDKVMITVENIGDEPFMVDAIRLVSGDWWLRDNRSDTLEKGDKFTREYTVEELFGLRNIISGGYLIQCHLQAPKGSSYKDVYLPINIDAGGRDSLIISHPRDDFDNNAYGEEDITFTLKNDSDKTLTIDKNFSIDEYNYGTKYWNTLKKIPYEGKTELAPGETAEFVYPYDCDGLTDFFGRLAVNFSAENGEEQLAYSLFSIRAGGFHGDAKPVIYLYPEEETDVSVSLDYKGTFTCTYPDYGNGWEVTAYPDGKIINRADGLEYSYLFWEGISNAKWDMSEGYVVKGSETAKFLRETLSAMGLTPKEYNEFIVYWLPKMQDNKYNLITFQQEVYEETAKLNISPNPDSVLRVFMVYKPLDEEISVKAPTIEKFERNGFTVIEWGGQAVPADRTRP